MERKLHQLYRLYWSWISGISAVLLISSLLLNVNAEPFPVPNHHAQSVIRLSPTPKSILAASALPSATTFWQPESSNPQQAQLTTTLPPFSLYLSHTSAVTTVNSERLLKKIKQQLYGQLNMASKPNQTLALELLLPAVQQNRLNQMSRCDLETPDADWVENPRFFNSRPIFQANCKTAQGLTQRFGLPVRVHLMAPVWVLNQEVMAGQMISPHAVSQEIKDIAGHLEQFIPGSEALSGLQARTSMHTGSVLDRRLISPIPAIRLNASILMHFATEGMEIDLTGIALQEGQIGQMIRVKQTQGAKRVLMAEVTGPNRVKVDLSGG
jgi:flagella basal body P-ring formation protein FlgA